MRGAASVVFIAATSLACGGHCDEAVPIVAGEYTIGEHLY